MAELADAPDLGSGALRRGGSSPFSRTNYIKLISILYSLVTLYIYITFEAFLYLKQYIPFK